MNFIERFVKFGLVGVLGVAVNFGFFIIFREVVGLPDFFSKALAIEISILNNFFFNFFWTWSDRGRTLRTFWQRILRYHGSTFIASFVVTIAGSYLARFVVRLIEWDSVIQTLSFGIAPELGQERWVAYIAYLIGIALGMVANFILSDRWVFTNPKAVIEASPEEQQR